MSSAEFGLSDYDRETSIIRNTRGSRVTKKVQCKSIFAWFLGFYFKYYTNITSKKFLYILFQRLLPCIILVHWIKRCFYLSRFTYSRVRVIVTRCRKLQISTSECMTMAYHHRGL